MACRWYLCRLKSKWLLQLCAVPVLLCVPLLLCAYAVSETATARHCAEGSDASRATATRSHKVNAAIAVTFLCVSYGYMGRLLWNGAGFWTWVSLCSCYVLSSLWVIMWCLTDGTTVNCIDRMKMGEIDLWRRTAIGTYNDSFIICTAVGPSAVLFHFVPVSDILPCPSASHLCLPTPACNYC